MAARFTLESVGPGATIQDGGRFGWLRFGVTPAGPMDWAALETANRALGNAPGAAAFEIAPGGLVVATDTPVRLAFAGGGFVWTRGDTPLPPAGRILLRPGEALRARSGAWGAFAYCAVPGGLDVPAVMGSRSTHVRSALGGLDGRWLHAGDRLSPSQGGPALDDIEIVASWLQPSSAPIRIVFGPQDDHFSGETLAAFLAATFTLTSAADRMAYKLNGPALAHCKDFNIVSDGIALGAIQVAGDGLPMVLMADRQPTGGYAKIAHVCRADIGRLAQMRPGDECRFEAVEIETARAALLDLEDRIADTLAHVVPLRLVPSVASLAQANLVGGVTDGDL